MLPKSIGVSMKFIFDIYTHIAMSKSTKPVCELTEKIYLITFFINFIASCLPKLDINL
jgi:hypothetical protein